MDVFSEEFATDPYSQYARIRDGARIQREVQPNGMVSWIVPGYELVRQVLTDPALFSSNLEHADQENLRRGGVIGSRGHTTLGGPAMIISDPPVHTRLRRLVNKAFTPGRVDALRPRVQALADQLVDRIAPRGSVDLIAEFTEPLPAIVICELLGIDSGSHGDCRAWLTDMLATPTSPLERERKEHGGRALASFLGALVARRQPHVDLQLPEAEQPDRISALIRARDGEGSLTDPELVGMLLLLFLAGQETTRNLIGNGMLALFQHPDQLALLRARPELLPSAIEEFLRWQAPSQRVTYRVPTRDVELGGVEIPAGSLLSLLVGSANRDPARFPDPDRLDITRRDHQHLGFGYGIHYCIGAPLARMESAIGIGTLLARLPALRLAADAKIRWLQTSIFIRGLVDLRVEFGSMGTADRLG